MKIESIICIAITGSILFGLFIVALLLLADYAERKSTHYWRGLRDSNPRPNKRRPLSPRLFNGGTLKRIH